MGRGLGRDGCIDCRDDTTGQGQGKGKVKGKGPAALETGEPRWVAVI